MATTQGIASIMRRVESRGILAVLAASIALWTGCQSLMPQIGRSALPLREVARYQDEDLSAQAGRESLRDPAALSPRDGSAPDGSGADPNPMAVDAAHSARTEAGSASPADRSQIVREIRITGNERLAEHQILRHIRTRPGRYYDPDLLQEDLNQIWRMKDVRSVNGPYLDIQPDGIVVTFDISERPVMERVLYIGNRAIADRKLAAETGLADGEPLDMHAVRMAKSRIEELYREKGFPNSQVVIESGDNIDDREVVFVIFEDEQQRVSWVSFEGNQVASDQRLRSLIKVKPGMFWYIGGLMNPRELEQDELRLMAYYRALGYFNARIGRELGESADGRWLSIRYVINEGPRYRVRSVSFEGNQRYSAEELASVVKLKPADGETPEFNAAKMNEDVMRLTDLYGSEGYVFANVVASPDFLEQPGQLDLVYKIEEGEQYRVGNINVVIEGEYGITKRQVILNRLGLRPGDPINTRVMRDAEARLIRSQLFSDGMAAEGPPPRLVVKPPELEEHADTRIR
jgi:outer membrane protein insertion porin family